MKKIKINETITPYIKKVLPFRFLSDLEVEELIEESEILHCCQDEIIITQGEIDKSLFAVLKGNVKVTVDNE
ncbi:MAG: hypothetical protein JXR64_07500 [Spirochaetales bacterium]|nr:hypothetical protein [Spirochaetales bacterium]